MQLKRPDEGRDREKPNAELEILAIFAFLCAAVASRRRFLRLPNVWELSRGKQR